jgi:hypothetical protein
MNILSLPNEIFINEVFPYLELSDLFQFEKTSTQLKELVSDYVHHLAIHLGFPNIYKTKDLIDRLLIDLNLSQIQTIFNQIIRVIILKIESLRRFQIEDEEEIKELNHSFKETFDLFENELKQSLDTLNHKPFLKPNTYSILQNFTPLMGLTFQNTDTRILEQLFPEWDNRINRILKNYHFSRSDIDQIRTELNSRIYLMLRS